VRSDAHAVCGRGTHCVGRLFFAVFVLLLVAACRGHPVTTEPTASPPPNTALVGAAAQTMEGFGASGAWWPNDLVDFAPAVQQRVADLLFTSGGIGLSVYRYNIGGGGVGVNNPTRAPATFLVRPGHYDWSRDPGGMLFLRAARDRKVPILLGFANSAPPPWTTNGQSCGGKLTPGAEVAYATYLADIVAHLRVSEGITLSYVSPMNEPDSTFASCGQEGMQVPVDQRATLINALAVALDRRTPFARGIADESNKTSDISANGPQWLGSNDAAQHIAAIAHHTYDYPDDTTLRAAAQVGVRFGKPLWMTEICCYNGSSFGANYDPTMTSGLWLANAIWQDLTQANDAAFHWWVALSSAIGCSPATHPGCAAMTNGSGWNDGLLYYDPDFRRNGNQTIYFTNRYWVFGNFSRYVRPGAVRYAVDNAPEHVRLLAFTQNGAWTLIAINNASTGSDPKALRLRFPIGAARLRITGAYATSVAHDLAPVALPAFTANGTLTAMLPSQSVTTILLQP
jgi:O-glycosyl hydrolase